MASTLGVLDVLSRLREDSERASTALKAQEDTNRGLLERCIHAETESGRTDDVKEALHRQKRQLEEGRRVAETTRKEAEGRLRRLQMKQAARKEAAERSRMATLAAARGAVDSSKKFRAQASESLRQIGELRARLRDKKRELESAQEENKELENEMDSKRATRDKLKAEVASREETVAAVCSNVDNADRENKSTLARVKHVEEEIEEIQQAKDEMQEMAVGLHRKNATLRNELRHLKREVNGGGGRSASQARQASSREQNNDRGGNGALMHSRPSSARAGTNSRNEFGAGAGSSGGNYYQHSPAPRKSDSRTRASSIQVQASSPYQRPLRGNAVPTPTRTLTIPPSSSSTNTKVRGSFLTAASVMGMPELRLSSPHPGGRTANNHRK